MLWGWVSGAMSFRWVLGAMSFVRWVSGAMSFVWWVSGDMSFVRWVLGTMSFVGMGVRQDQILIQSGALTKNNWFSLHNIFDDDLFFRFQPFIYTVH